MAKLRAGGLPAGQPGRQPEDGTGDLSLEGEAREPEEGLRPRPSSRRAARRRTRTGRTGGGKPRLVGVLAILELVRRSLVPQPARRVLGVLAAFAEADLGAEGRGQGAGTAPPVPFPPEVGANLGFPDHVERVGARRPAKRDERVETSADLVATEAATDAGRAGHWRGPPHS